MVSNESGDSMDYIIWEMPILMVFKCISIIYTMKTGEIPTSHKDKMIIKEQQKAYMELSNAK